MAPLRQSASQSTLTCDVACAGLRGLQQVRRARSSSRTSGRVRDRVLAANEYLKNEQVLQSAKKKGAGALLNGFKSDDLPKLVVKEETAVSPVKAAEAVAKPQPLPQSVTAMLADLFVEKPTPSVVKPQALPPSVTSMLAALFPERPKASVKPQPLPQPLPPSVTAMLADLFVDSSPQASNKALPTPTTWVHKPSVGSWLRLPCTPPAVTNLPKESPRSPEEPAQAITKPQPLPAGVTSMLTSLFADSQKAKAIVKPQALPASVTSMLVALFPERPKTIVKPQPLPPSVTSMLADLFAESPEASDKALPAPTTWTHKPSVGTWLRQPAASTHMLKAIPSSPDEATKAIFKPQALPASVTSMLKDLFPEAPKVCTAGNTTKSDIKPQASPPNVPVLLSDLYPTKPKALDKAPKAITKPQALPSSLTTMLAGLFAESPKTSDVAPAARTEVSQAPLAWNHKPSVATWVRMPRPVSAPKASEETIASHITQVVPAPTIWTQKPSVGTWLSPMRR